MLLWEGARAPARSARTHISSRKADFASTQGQVNQKHWTGNPKGKRLIYSAWCGVVYRTRAMGSHELLPLLDFTKVRN